MPIQGLTDVGRSRFPTGGIIRKGAPRPADGRRPGEDLEWFRFTSDDTRLLDRWREIYGDKPSEVRVYLPGASADDNFEAWREHWEAGGLIHRCDGINCVLWRDPHTAEIVSTPRKCPFLNAPRAEKLCKPVGRLSVLIRDFGRMVGVTVLTTSLHDIMELQGNLAALEMITGNLRGIPLVLSRAKRKISMPDQKNKGKRLRLAKSLLRLEADPKWVQFQLAAQEHMATPRLDGSRPALASGPALLPTRAESVYDAYDPDPEPAPARAPARRFDTMPMPDEPEDSEGRPQRPETTPAAPSTPTAAMPPQQAQTPTARPPDGPMLPGATPPALPNGEGRQYSQAELITMFDNLRAAAVQRHGMVGVGTLDARLPVEAMISCIKALRDAVKEVKGGRPAESVKLVFPTLEDIERLASDAETPADDADVGDGAAEAPDDAEADPDDITF